MEITHVLTLYKLPPPSIMYVRCLVAISECYFASHYFDENLTGAQADQEVLKELIKEKLPTLASHLRELDIEIGTISLNWFLAIFFDAVPFEVDNYMYMYIPLCFSKN